MKRCVMVILALVGYLACAEEKEVVSELKVEVGTTPLVRNWPKPAKEGRFEFTATPEKDRYFKEKTATVTPEDSFFGAGKNTREKAYFYRISDSATAGKMETWTFEGEFEPKKGNVATGTVPKWKVTTNLNPDAIVTIKRQLDIDGAEFKLISQENQNKEAAVGHWIKLNGYLTKDGVDISPQATGWQWTINGVIVKSYTTTKQLGEKKDLTDKDKQIRHIEYYYIAGSGDQVIDLTVTYATKVYTGSDSILVKRPTDITLKSFINTEGLPGSGVIRTETKLSFGKEEFGITCNANATAPVIGCPEPLTGKGQYAAFQRVLFVHNKTTNGDGQKLTWDSGLVLDRVSSNDNPEYNDKIEVVDSGAKVNPNLVTGDAPAVPIEIGSC